MSGYRISKLDRELRAAAIPIDGVRQVGASTSDIPGDVVQDVIIDFRPEATQAQRDLAAAIKAAHDPTDTDKLNAGDVKARWRASAIAGKTPAEIYTQMQTRIDGWGSLTAAKADLREWLPLLAAALAWTAMEDAQNR
jgi:hypothetical protein